jgi:hypothetical protein
MSLMAAGSEAWPALAEEVVDEIKRVQAPAELIEKSFSLRKPTLLVYCRKYSNQLEERFRGRGTRYEVVVEVLATSDRLEGLRPSAMEYADAVADVLQRKAGCLGNSMYLREQVEASFETAKKGGLNVSESVKLSCTVEWKEE